MIKKYLLPLFFALGLLRTNAQIDCAKIYTIDNANAVKTYDPIAKTMSPTVFTVPFQSSALGLDPLKKTLVAVGVNTNANADVYVYNPATNTGVTYPGLATNPGASAYNRLTFSPARSIAYLFNLSNSVFTKIDFATTTPTVTTLTATGVPPTSGNDYIGGDIVMDTRTKGYLLTSGFATGKKYFYSFTVTGNTIAFTALGSTTTTGSNAAVALDPAGTGDLYFNSGADIYKFPITATGTFTATLHQSNVITNSFTDFASAEPPTTAVATGDQDLCNGGPSFTITGNTPTSSYGSWSLLSGSGIFTGNPVDAVTTVSVLPGNTAIFRYSIQNCSVTYDDVTISNGAVPTTANAGRDTSFCAATYIMNGNTPTIGTGTWTKVGGSGTITNPNSPNTTITGLTTGTSVFKWTISSGSCPISEDFVNITLGNCPPVALNDAFSTNIGVPITQTVATNDSDPNIGQILTFSIAQSMPSTEGTVVINTNGTFTFTPAAGYTGATSFIYKVCDNGTPVLCTNATVTITVAPLSTALDHDGDGIPNITDIDDDNDGILDVVEVCGIGATSFNCMPGGANPNADTDNDGLLNYQDPDYCTLNNKGVCANLDADADGTIDTYDLDSDNDGISDVVEAGGNDPNNDGIIGSGTFVDSDADGLSDIADPNNGGAPLTDLDSDNDGVLDSQDLDSDNDGIADVIESGNSNLDANKDGMVDGSDTDNDGVINVPSLDNNSSIGANFANPDDKDGDGVIDSEDLDSDNDGITDIRENGTSGLDLNNDGIVDGTDTDGDGIINVSSIDNNVTMGGNFSTPLDFDGDGIPNNEDIDADNDGITDVRESGGADTDGNGIIDGTDSDGDGVLSSADNLGTIFGAAGTTPVNTDNTGNPNYIDIDADNDGIVDNIEGQTTLDYLAPSGIDSDKDGLDNVYDNNDGVFGGNANNGVAPTNTDNTDNPDYTDLDTDNDSRTDIVEGWDTDGNGIAETIASGLDADDDGLDDAFDNNDNQVNPNNGQTPISFPNLNSIVTEIDWREDFVKPITAIGIAKSATKPQLRDDASFDITYTIKVKNYGAYTLNNLQVVDNLYRTFPSPVTHTIVSLSATNGIVTAANFSKTKADTLLLATGNSLAPGNEFLLFFTVNVKLNSAGGIYKNTAIASGYTTNGQKTEDISYNGENPDPNGNNNPSDAGEDSTTNVEIKQTTLFIPSGFSPDGDGVNDTFVIVGIEAFKNNDLQIFNRWGNVVYKKDNYDNSWNAESNADGKIMGDKVQSGTYYYILNLKDTNTAKTGYIEIRY